MKKRIITHKKFKKCVIATSILTLVFWGTSSNYPLSCDKNEEKTVASNELNELVLAGIDLSDYDLSLTQKIINQNKLGEEERKTKLKAINLKKEISEKEEKEKEKRINMINTYSNIYNLNKKKVYEIIKENTNYFSKKSLLKNIKDKEIELKILKKVRDIKNNPSSYNVSLSKITENVYKKKKNIREMVDHYSNLYDMDSKLVLAIEGLESGWYKEPIASSLNNPGSIRYSNGDYIHFENLEQGIIANIDLLSRKYKGMPLTEMQKIYAGNSKTWAENVGDIYKILKYNPKHYSIYDEKK